jgi:hypothetical protein
LAAHNWPDAQKDLQDEGDSGPYAKKESLRFMPWLYHHPNVPCLERKRAKYHNFLVKIGRAALKTRCEALKKVPRTQNLTTLFF